MANLKENDRSVKNFCNDVGLKYDIQFSKWTQRKSPNIEQVIASDGGSTNVEFHKLILCDPHTSEQDPDVKKHFVLFVKETTTDTPDYFTENVNFDHAGLNDGDKVRFIVVRYFLNDLQPVPPYNQIDCNLYYAIANAQGDTSGGVSVPDTTQGEIIIKR